MKPPAFLHRLLKTKRSRRILYLALALLLFLLASPFLFTAPLLRFYLAHSAYRDLPLHFRTARLSPAGTLTLYDLDLTGTSPTPWHLSAPRAEVTFSFSQASARHLRTLSLHDMQLALDPAFDTALAPSLGNTTAPPITPPNLGLTCDQLIADGHLHFTGTQTWMERADLHPGETLPIHAILKLPAAPGTAWNASVVLGDTLAPDQRFLICVFGVQPQAGKTTINIDQLQLGNLSPKLALAKTPGFAGFPHDVYDYITHIHLSGSLTLFTDHTFDATARLLDLTARSPDGALTLNHLSAAARITRNTSNNKDIQLSGLRCAWDSLGMFGWKLDQGVAECQTDGHELLLSSAMAQCAGVPVNFTAALDLTTGLLTRARASTAPFPIQKLTLFDSSLPIPPSALGGQVVLRTSLREFDRDHAAAYVELACPDSLTFNVPGEATPAAAAPARSADMPGLVLYNSILSGTLSWNFRGNPLPDITRGRLTADQLLVLPEQSRKGGTALNRIRADFNLAGGRARLEDCYADLPGNGRMSLEGNVALADGSFDDWVISLNGIDMSLLNPWLPAGWSLAGQMDTEWHGMLSRRAAALDVSLGLGSQTTLQGPTGKLLLSGTGPAAALRFSVDRRTRATLIEHAEIGGVGALQADAGMMRELSRAAALPPENPAARLLERFAGGSYASFDKMAFAGHIGPTEAAGTLSCVGLDLGAGNPTQEQKDLALQNLTLKADMSSGLAASYRTMAANMRVTGGQFLAEKLTLGQLAYSEISGGFAAEKGRAQITLANLAVADGTAEGNATLNFDGTLDALRLGFTGLHQQQLWRNAFSDLFSAEGRVSGWLTLQRGTDGRLGGLAAISSDEPGRVKFTRAAAEGILRAGSSRGDGLPPASATGVWIEQLADYPYVTARVGVTEEAGGLQVKLDCPRPPLKAGEPGFGVPLAVGGQTVPGSTSLGSMEFDLRGTLNVPGAMTNLLARFAGVPAPAK